MCYERRCCNTYDYGYYAYPVYQLCYRPCYRPCYSGYSGYW